MTAMRYRPDEFEMQESWLKHRASGHCFLLRNGALVRIEASCSCAELRAEPSQTAMFERVLETWTADFWRPLQTRHAAERRAAEINRNFSDHSRPPRPLARLARRVVQAWHAAMRELQR